MPDRVPVAGSMAIHAGAFATRNTSVMPAVVTVAVGRKLQATPSTAAVIGEPLIVRAPVTDGGVGLLAAATVSVNDGPATVVWPSVTATCTPV